MNYRITDEMSLMAEKMIENDDVNDRYANLVNKIKQANVNVSANNVVLSDDEYQSCQSSINKLNDMINVLNFKKDNLNVDLDRYLEVIDVGNVVRIKEEIAGIDNELAKVINNKSQLTSKLKDSQIDYDNQMIKIRDKYKSMDVLTSDFVDDEFSANVIASYKKECVSNLVNQFLSSVPEEKRKEFLNNEELKGYINVGKNI